jgi:hypothetical protein
VLLGVALFLLAQVTPPAPDGAPEAAAPAARALDVTALSFTVAQPRIVLGDTAAVDVTIVAKRADGGPLDVARPALRVSTGTVSAPKRTAAGTWVTTFTPPAEQFPHVAILFASVETSTMTAVGFVPLHLWGKGQTTVRTKPKSQVTVFIGNESFGPVAAAANGAAKVDIVVPPGPEHAVARSIDEVGNESQKTIDLGVPTFNRLAAMALDDTVTPEGSARVLAFVVDKKGEPLFDAKLTGRASSGSVGDVDGLAPGMFRLIARPAASAKGKVTVEVALEGAASSKARAILDVIAGTPARALLSASKSALSADDARAITVDVKLVDAGGNPITPRAATVDVDLGRVDDVDDTGNARQVTWVLPAELVKPKATLTVRTPAGTVLGTQEIALFAGRPAAASFDKVEAVVADGAASVEVRLRVVDAAGNALVPTGAAFQVEPSIGRFVAGTVDGKTYRARFVPEPRDHDDIATLRGTVAGLAAETNVRLVPRPRARLLVGPGVVVGTNYGSLVQAGPDLSLLVRLPGFDGGVHAGLNVSMLQSVSAPAGVDHRAFPVVVEAAWRPLLTPDLAAHVGVAAGFVLTDELQGDARLVLPGALASVVTGLGYRLGPGFAELDLRVGFGDTFPTSTTVGLPLGAAVVAGYRFGI